MKCKVCGGPTRVVDKDGAERRRQCADCGQRVTTVEVPKDERKREQQAVQTVLDAARKLDAS